MISSLYTRVVLTFLVSVIGGTIIATFTTSWLYKEKLNDNLMLNVFHFGEDVSRIYDALPLAEAEAYVRGMKQLHSYYIRMYDQGGRTQSFGELNGQSVSEVTPEQISRVLAGEVLQISSQGIVPVLMGMPLHTEAGTKAMFVEPLAASSVSLLVRFLTNSLIIGSLLILIAAVFLVRPIKKLTKATKRIAAGDFNVKLNIKQKGELGTLARSFEEMMRDLKQLEQMRKEFVSNVSHEVQSPLTSISGYAIALKQAGIPESERNRYLDIIISEAKRMSKMSDSLLKLSLLESSTQQLRVTELRLDEQIRRVIVAIQPQWSARSISFDINLKPIPVTADHDQLNQVWTNIIGNSIKFSEEGGTIHVSMKQDAKTVTVRIADDGIGISGEDQKRIFERFFKADRSHSRKYDGSGMGLAIAKQIVSLHQGHIHVVSQLGRGAAFIVTLPLASAE